MSELCKNDLVAIERLFKIGWAFNNYLNAVPEPCRSYSRDTPNCDLGAVLMLFNGVLIARTELPRSE